MNGSRAASIRRAKRATLLPGLFAVAWLGCAQSAAAATLHAPGGGRILAFIVGVDHYEHFTDLHGSVADADDIRGALHRAGVPDADVTVIKEEQVSRAAFVDRMDHLVAAASPGDLVMITFSGHGNRVPELPIWKGLEPEGMNEQFVLPGYDLRGPATKEVVMNKEMKAWLSRLQGKGADVLFIADTCFGGGMTRAIDPRTAAPIFRAIRGAAVDPDDNQFQPIADLTRKELLTQIGDLSHVTTIAGGDSKHLVPEVRIPGAATTRGALSYAVARAIEGAASDKTTGTTTRFSMLGYVLQIVQQYSEGNQLIDAQPTTEDEKVLARPLFRLGGNAEAFRPPDVPEREQRPRRKALRLAVPNSDSRLIDVLPKGLVPYVIVEDIKDADLIWDRDHKETLQGNDIIKQDVDPREIPGIVDRTRAIADLKTLSESRAQRVDLRDGGKRYTPRACSTRAVGDCPRLEVRGIGEHNLIVFNIAADGLIQTLSLGPGPGQDSRSAKDAWAEAFTVVPPFGADCAVAIVSSHSLRDLETWLRNHDKQPAAGLLVEEIQKAIGADPTLRIGLVTVYTGP